MATIQHLSTYTYKYSKIYQTARGINWAGNLELKGPTYYYTAYAYPINIFLLHNDKYYSHPPKKSKQLAPSLNHFRWKLFNKYTLTTWNPYIGFGYEDLRLCHTTFSLSHFCYAICNPQHRNVTNLAFIHSFFEPSPPSQQRKNFKMYILTYSYI